MNGHFAAIGQGPSAQRYNHGIQVVDEEKEFKFVLASSPPHPPSISLYVAQHLSTLTLLLLFGGGREKNTHTLTDAIAQQPPR